MASAGMAVQSLLNFITNNKNLNLVFKSGSEKISISIHELPEANLETKINFEKLSADFKKAGISAEADPAGSLLSEVKVSGDNESILSNSGNNTAAIFAMPVSAESAGGNIYKAEVIEVSAKPSAEFTKSGQTAFAAGSKYYGYPGSGMDKEAIPVLKQFGFQPVENGAEEGAAFVSASESGISIPETGKGAVNISGLERAGADKLIEGEMNNSNTKISAEAISSAGDAGSANRASGAAGSPLYVQQNSPVFKVIDAESLKPLNADAHQTNEKHPSGNDEELLKNLLEKVDSIPEALFSKRSNLTDGTSAAGNEVKAATSPVAEFDNTSLDEFVKTATEELKKLSTEETVLKKIVFNDETAPVNGEIKDEKQAGTRKNPASAGSRIFGAEPEIRTTADQLILKNNMNKENSDPEKDDNSGKADLKVAGGVNKEPVKNAQGKTSDEKTSSKQKPEDGFKNIMQNSESVTNAGADKFKNIPEMKPLHESMKIIKAPEIVNEFSKIIQAGEKQTMTFQLTPENLGKVKLIVDLVENQINTRIEVENENVKQFIQSNIEQLKQSLQSSGIHLSQLNISLADSEQKSAKPFTRKKADEKVSKFKEDEKESGAVHKALGYNTYEFLA
jgi:flagellar hook-length control protein FliK